ncbi:MAG: DUF503 domain-containing protein [Thermovirgaceae bacterium]|nr:DUF503 domain-containing protein [Thermovirgaceae bacterium]
MKDEFSGPFVGVMVIQLKIPNSLSLKDRRQVVRSLLEKARSRFNVSVADLGPDGSHQDAFLAFSAVSPSSSSAEERIASLERLIRTMEDSGDFFVVRETREVERNAGFSD